MRAALWLGLACASCSAPPPTGDLVGALAVVGSQRLTAARFGALHDQRPPSEFVAAWCRMELLAQAAEARGLVHEPHTSALVRRLVSGWTAQEATPPVAQPDEIALARNEQWQRYDRGPARIVHHAVFMKARNGRPSFAADAKELGRTLHERVQAGWDFAQFEAAARALILPPGVELRVEQLPGFVEDGRAIDGPSGFDATFARQAFSLQKAGDFTAPFETRFGVHVVQLEKTLEPLRLTDAEVGAALQVDLVGQRVRRLQSAALAARGGRLPVVSETAASDMEAVVRTVLGEERTETAQAP